MKRYAWALFIIVGLISESGCNSVFGPDELDRNWRVFESPHYLVHVRPNSYAEQNIKLLVDNLEAHYAYVLNSLEISYAGIIAVFFYNSPKDAGLPGPGGSALPWTECVRAVCGSAYGGIYTAAHHEVTHVLTHNALGRPGTRFMSEGTAMGVAMEEGLWRYWNGSHIHSYTRQLITSGRLPALKTLIDDSSWRELGDDITYPASGSFVLYLLERFGAFPIKQLFITPSKAFAQTFEKLYGQTLEEMESAWRAYCLEW